MFWSFSTISTWDLYRIGEEAAIARRLFVSSLQAAQRRIIHHRPGYFRGPNMAGNKILEIAIPWNQLVLSDATDRLRTAHILNLTHTEPLREFCRRFACAARVTVPLNAPYGRANGAYGCSKHCWTLRLDPYSASGAQRGMIACSPHLLGVDHPSLFLGTSPRFYRSGLRRFRLFEVGTVRRIVRIALRQGQE